MSSAPQLRAHDHHIDLSTQHVRVPDKRLEVLVPRTPQTKDAEGVGLGLLLRDGGERVLELVEQSAPDDPRQHLLLRTDLPGDVPLSEMHLQAPKATRPSLVAPAGSISELGPLAQEFPLRTTVRHLVEAGTPFVLIHGQQARERAHDIRIPFGARHLARRSHLMLVQRYVPEHSGGHVETTTRGGRIRQPFVNQHCLALRAKVGNEKNRPRQPGNRYLHLSADAIRPGTAIELGRRRFSHLADINGTVNFSPEFSRSENVQLDGIDMWLNAVESGWEVRGITVNRPTVICTRGAITEHFDHRELGGLRFYDFLQRAKELGPDRGFHVIE